MSKEDFSEFSIELDEVQYCDICYEYSPIFCPPCLTCQAKHCSECHFKILKSNISKCPMCRTPMTYTV